MNNDRDLIHAAMKWHAASVRRQAIGKARRRIAKDLKAAGLPGFSPLYRQEAEAARALTEAKRQELAALKLLARACVEHRVKLEEVGFVEVESGICVRPEGHR